MVIKTITPRELKTKLDAGEDLQLIDVREEHERAICSIGGDLIPKDTVLQNADKISREKPVVVYCRSGGRSGNVVRELQTQLGFTNLVNLEGGVLRWSDDVDPTVVKY